MTIYIVVRGCEYDYPSFIKAFENYNDALLFKKELELQIKKEDDCDEVAIESVPLIKK